MAGCADERDAGLGDAGRRVLALDRDAVGVAHRRRRRRRRPTPRTRAATVPAGTHTFSPVSGRRRRRSRGSCGRADRLVQGDGDDAIAAGDAGERRRRAEVRQRGRRRPSRRTPAPARSARPTSSSTTATSSDAEPAATDRLPAGRCRRCPASASVLHSSRSRPCSLAAGGLLSCRWCTRSVRMRPVSSRSSSWSEREGEVHRRAYLPARGNPSPNMRDEVALHLVGAAAEGEDHACRGRSTLEPRPQHRAGRVGLEVRRPGRGPPSAAGTPRGRTRCRTP